MASIQMQGTWYLRVVGKESDWPQRIMIGGSTDLVVPGRVGASAVIQGGRWYLTVEHHNNGVWRANPGLHVADGQHQGRATRRLTTKDFDWGGPDLDFDDLTIELEVAPQSGEFAVVGSPVGVDDRLQPVASGAIGDRMYFPVDPARAQPGPVSVEFELRQPGHHGSRRHSQSSPVQVAPLPPTPGRDALADGRAPAMAQAPAGPDGPDGRSGPGRSLGTRTGIPLGVMARRAGSRPMRPLSPMKPRQPE